jgi:hypothetical protein
VTGSGFSEAKSVTFGSLQASSFSVVSDTQINTTVPQGVTGSVDVTVTTPVGTSAAGANDKFSNVPPSPVVQSTCPSSGPDGTAVTLIGSGFTGATSVAFGSVASPNVSVVSDAKIVAVSPLGGNGTVDVVVTTPTGQSSTSSSDQFSYTAPVLPQPTTTATAAGNPGNVSPQGYYVDPGLSSQLVGSIVSLLQTASSPDAAEARNMILRRLALQGDVVGSRIPPPKNISEIGGYINLLASLKQYEMRSQMLAGILGVAGPSQPLGWDSGDPPLAFVSLTNDRPVCAGQAGIPLTFNVRSDFCTAVQSVVDALHQRGCALPFSGPAVLVLPPAAPGQTVPDDVLPYLGRTLSLATTAALADPASDPLLLVRPAGTSGPFQVAAQVISPGVVAVNPGSYDALQCGQQSCAVVAVGSAQLVAVAGFLAAAGFYLPSPLPTPSSSRSGQWARLTNVTGLVPGTTTLGDELSLLYKTSAINRSIFASALHRVWNGTGFA